MFESDEPVILPITDVLDLHAFAPRDVTAAVEEYLVQAARLGIAQVRLIHGKGIGFQREAVRQILSNSRYVVEFWDAPPERGGKGATLADLSTSSDT